MSKEIQNTEHFPIIYTRSGKPYAKQAADEPGGDNISGAAEEALGEVLGGRGGYGSGMESSRHIATLGTTIRMKELSS
jgi:hypothetical protein